MYGSKESGLKGVGANGSLADLNTRTRESVHVRLATEGHLPCDLVTTVAALA